MTKVVYNACYGGFGLSEAAMLRYAELKGFKLYVEKDGLLAGGTYTYWKVPPEERTGILSDDQFNAAPMAERAASNQRYYELTLNAREIDRADPVLAQVVEELGDAASGKFAKLRIEEVPAGTLYRIDEYDGNESVMTQTDYEWKLA